MKTSHFKPLSKLLNFFPEKFKSFELLSKSLKLLNFSWKKFKSSKLLLKILELLNFSGKKFKRFKLFMTFVPTKTTLSQRGKLFAKSNFHESIHLNAEVLYLRNSESCTPSRSVHLARRAKYTERLLRAATRFLKR